MTNEIKWTPFKFAPKKFGDYIVLDVDYHRNGICGEGFYTGIFEDMNGDQQGKRFTFVMFPSFSGWEEGKEYEVAKEYTYDDASGDYRCAVLCLDDMNSGTAESAWRGDYFYHAVVQDAIKELNKQKKRHYKKLEKK